MKAKKVKETAEQKAERLRAQALRIKTVQKEVSERTTQFQRLTNPRASLFGSMMQRRVPLF